MRGPSPVNFGEHHCGWRPELAVGRQQAFQRGRIDACHRSTRLWSRSVFVPCPEGYRTQIGFRSPESGVSTFANLLLFAAYISGGKSSMSKRLAGLLPLSKLAASLVARLIRSGRLVRLPRACSCLTASMSSRGGRRIAESRLKPREYRASASTKEEGSDARRLPTFFIVLVSKANITSSEEGAAIDEFLVLTVLEEFVDVSKNPVPSEKTPPGCTGTAAGRWGEICESRPADVGVRVVTSAAFPLRPTLALRTNRLSSPSSS